LNIRERSNTRATLAGAIRIESSAILARMSLYIGKKKKKEERNRESKEMKKEGARRV